MNESETHETELNVARALERFTPWLLRVQGKDSQGWADQPGRAVSTLNTAEVIIALLDSQAVSLGDRRIQQSVEFLLKHQYQQGLEMGAWPREVAAGERDALPHHTSQGRSYYLWDAYPPGSSAGEYRQIRARRKTGD